MQDAMAIFPKLQTGLDVNVKFDRCWKPVCLVVLVIATNISGNLSPNLNCSVVSQWPVITCILFYV